MVKTRELGRALGMVVDRGLGRRDHDYSDGAPQRRRPTALARRQRVPVTVADDAPAVPADEPMVDVDAQDTDAEANAQDTGVEAATDEAKEFPGGPKDPSVLMEYAQHVAASVWSGEERPKLKLSSHGRKVHKLGMHVPAIEEMVVGTGLSSLIACSIDTGNRELISSFVERWHRETSTFHLLVGEGATHVDFVFLDALRDLTQTRRYAWGAAGLVHMYDHLNDASINTSRQVTGYITLLQCWIYEHFPSVAECNADLEYDEVSPRACRWIATKKTVKKISTSMYRQRLDRLKIPNLRWGPVVVKYRPERVMRQFGYVQCIPAHPVDSWVSFDDIDDR
ncbi:protein MAIN-LIKE 1-like [Glycine soja]|uniref:protein MAIN-LIKE 1-like n=1 Tax=Glycine soja TaxID=3848 RepID=UPI00103D9512|nr:protein MAIN-LIKE 1-like [Glycine soja]